MNTNDRDQQSVRRALGELRLRAGRDSDRLPVPDVDALIASARAPQRRPDTRAFPLRPRLAAAAAIVIVATGALLVLRQPPAPNTGPAPEPLVSLVDSLYDEPDYLDGVWSTVLTELGSTP